jgi:hypothetical protein
MEAHRFVRLHYILISYHLHISCMISCVWGKCKTIFKLRVKRGLFLRFQALTLMVMTSYSSSWGLYTVFIMQAYQTSQYVVPCGGIFLGKWRSSFAGSSDGKMNVQSACALNTRYYIYIDGNNIFKGTCSLRHEISFSRFKN